MDSFEELLQEFDIPYVNEEHHHVRPGWIGLDCPDCGPDTGKYHLGFNLSGSYFNCWQCGRKDMGKTLALVLDVPEGKAFGLAKALRNADTGFQVERTDKRKGLVEPGRVGKLQEPHKRYLRGRGFNPKRLERLWGLKGIGIAGRLSWRIYIPIFHHGVQISWTTRSIAEHAENRYISASPEEEAMNHKETVYGLDHCRHSVVIVEGPADVWNIGPGAGALFGLEHSTSQINELIGIPYRFVCFDSSKAAQKRAEELCDQLSVFPGETQNIVLDAEDPGSASKKEITKLRKAARL